MSRMKILCVEHEPEYMATLACMLEGIGYEVMAATSGKQAIDLVSQQSIDGVLLEYDLPDATGTNLRAKLKRIHPDVPMLVFAGVGVQTPFMLRFFDAYLRNGEHCEGRWADFES